MKRSINLLLGLSLLTITLLAGCASSAKDSLKEDYGRRTLGTIIEDNTIQAKAKKNINDASETLKKSNINIESFNKVLLITGQVPNQASKDLVSKVTQSIRHVTRIHNELSIAPNGKPESSPSDAFLSSKVRSRLLFTKGIKSGRIEIVVENSVLYLLGLVTQEEADRIVNAMQKISGLKRIVKVFGYIQTAKR